MPATTRYLPQRPFPPYAFVPGEAPHPTKDPQGHSFGVESELEHMPAEQWRTNDEYLFGVDLYNHGYFWEAHEAWEGLWQIAAPDPDQARFLQGLIQCSAASLKIAMAQPRGLERLSEAGTGRLEQVAREASPAYMGLDVTAFVADFRAFAASSPQSADERPSLELDT